MNSKEFVWVEKYRPARVEDVILPTDLKTMFLKFERDGDFPNLLLSGPKGMGKTSVAKALIQGIGADFYFINGSLQRNIDTIREQVAQFVSSVSFTDGRKYVLIDEADGLNPLTQPSLKAFIEEFSHNAGFIMTANHLSKVIPELQSRFTGVEFRIPNSEKPTIALSFMKRLEEILKLENVGYEKRALAALIQKHFPDWRRVLNECQGYAAKSPTGAIDSGILATISAESMSELIGFMKKKEFTSVRKWVAENSDQSAQALFKEFYDNAGSSFTSASIPEVVLVLAKYGFQSAFAVDQEVNTAAALLEIMLTAQWKD